MKKYDSCTAEIGEYCSKHGCIHEQTVDISIGACKTKEEHELGIRTETGNWDEKKSPRERPAKGEKC